MGGKGKKTVAGGTEHAVQCAMAYGVRMLDG